MDPGLRPDNRLVQVSNYRNVKGINRHKSQKYVILIWIIIKVVWYIKRFISKPNNIFLSYSKDFWYRKTIIFLHACTNSKKKIIIC